MFHETSTLLQDQRAKLQPLLNGDACAPTAVAKAAQRRPQAAARATRRGRRRRAREAIRSLLARRGGGGDLGLGHGEVLHIVGAATLDEAILLRARRGAARRPRSGPGAPAHVREMHLQMQMHVQTRARRTRARVRGGGGAGPARCGRCSGAPRRRRCSPAHEDEAGGEELRWGSGSDLGRVTFRDFPARSVESPR